MAKLPKFGDITDIQGMIDKVKSAVDSLLGPGRTEIATEALAKESDPIKRKFLEVDALIDQLSDIQLVQQKTLSTLKSKYNEVKKIAEKSLFTQEETRINVSTSEESTLKTEDQTVTDKPKDKPKQGE